MVSILFLRKYIIYSANYNLKTTYHIHIYHFPNIQNPNGQNLRANL